MPIGVRSLSSGGATRRPVGAPGMTNKTGAKKRCTASPWLDRNWRELYSEAPCFPASNSELMGEADDTS